jgi:hypothetical protein
MQNQQCCLFSDKLHVTVNNTAVRAQQHFYGEFIVAGNNETYLTEVLISP